LKLSLTFELTVQNLKVVSSVTTVRTKEASLLRQKHLQTLAVLIFVWPCIIN